MRTSTWSPFHIRDDGLGLITRQREDQVPPSAAVVARNVDFSDRTISKRRGFKRHLRGTLDEVLRGGPPGTSIVWRGDERKRSRPEDLFFQTRGKHWRHGIGVMPEFTMSDIRLNVRPADNRWAIEVMISGDELATNPDVASGAIGLTGSRTRANVPLVFMSKSEGTSYQWKVLLKPEATEDLNATQPYVVLRLRDPVGATDNDFYFNPAGVPGSFLAVGKRYWFGWEFDGTNVISYYREEGDAAAQSTSQAVPGGLAANGVGSAQYPVIFGGVSVRAPGGAVRTERNFNGSTPEVRFWSSGAASPVSHPDWTNPATDWHFDREITADKLNPDGTWADAAYNHLVLYLAFSGEQRSPSDPRMLLPRGGKNSGGIDFTKNKVWLTGADASWVAVSDGSTTRGLAFCPAADSPRQDDYMRAVTPSTTVLREPFGCGIRIPNANRYWQKLQSDVVVGGNTYQYTFHDGFGVQIRFRADGLESGMLDHVLFDMNTLVGPSVSAAPSFQVKLTWSGGAAKVALRYNMARTGAGPAPTTTIVGTTAIAAGTWYTVTASLAYQTGNPTDFHARASLYLDSNLEASYDPNALPDTVKKPFGSYNNTLDATAPNANTKDDRASVFFAALGCGLWTAEVGSENGQIGALAAGGYPNATLYPWGYQNDDCKFTGNDGIFGRYDTLFRGTMSRVAIFARELTRTDVDRWSTRAPTPAEVAAEGPALLSLWRMQEGVGGIVFDSGSLANHLRIMPYPRARIRSGPIARRKKSNILGAWEFRTRTPREGVRGREVYMLGGGSLSRIAYDGSGDRYAEPLAHGILCEQCPQPTAFQFADFAYICPGEGPVLRVSRSKVVPAGISPVWGEIQGGDLGFVEPDRDGTFFVTDQAGTVGAGGAFEGAKFYQYLLTYYDAEAAVESAPSRIRRFTVEKALAGQFLTHLKLFSMPVPVEKSVTHYRIYRTAADSDTFRFVDQIPINSSSYEDRKPDSLLGDQFDGALNYPPPLNCRIGIGTGTRAFYTGSDDQPGTFWWSKVGFPELVPPGYQATVTSSRSSRITGMAWQNDRVLIFLQDATLVAYDSGGDIGLGSSVGVPVQVGVVRDGVGCVEHNTIVEIPGVGTVFAGEQGIYVTGSGAQFQSVSDEIQPTYEALDRSTYRNWHAKHLRSRNCYILFCRTTDSSLVKDSTAGRNNFAIVWNYKTGKFATWTDIPAAWSTVIEDEADGMNRLLFSDYFGELWELAPDDEIVNNDGLGADVAVADGAVVSALNASTIRLFSSDTMPTGGDGLRGVMFQCDTGAAGAIEYRRIVENDGQWVALDAPLSSTPTSSNDWQIGAIASEWRGGMWDMGLPGELKRVAHAELNLSAGGAGVFYGELRFDGETVATPTTTAPSVAGNLWTIPASLRRYRIGPKVGRGDRLQVRLFDDAANTHWEITDCQVGFWPERSFRWRS